MYNRTNLKNAFIIIEWALDNVRSKTWSEYSFYYTKQGNQLFAHLNRGKSENTFGLERPPGVSPNNYNY